MNAAFTLICEAVGVIFVLELQQFASTSVLGVPLFWGARPWGNQDKMAFQLGTVPVMAHNARRFDSWTE